MKTKRIVYFILMFLPLLLTLLTLPFLPEQIPAHYGFDNQVTRWGSKYEALIYPITTIFMGYFLLAMAKLAAKQEKGGKNNENVLLISGIVVLVMFNIMNLYALYTDFHRIENLSTVSIDMYQLLFGLLGLLLIIIGNMMPKLRMNSIIGLRTPWSLKNEFIWKKSQRFGGISFLLSGVLILLLCMATRGFSCLLWSMLTLVITASIDIFYTYRISKKY
ncbi:MAG: SdpI family protein [Clostridiales bacterium]|nr:SdpI family protein [Clostridiales bacterium]